jgi:methyl-accepting chemotaxis protein
MPKLSIRDRLVVIVLLSLLPVLLLGYLFVTQSEKEIEFGAKEYRGTDYLEAVYPEFHDLALLRAPTQLADNLALAGKADLYNSEMNSAPAFDAYVTAHAALAKGGDLVAARKGAAVLVAKVGDGSNLILDPDLDSYYVMDLLVVKLPAAINGAADVLDLLDGVIATSAADEDARIALAAGLAGFRGIISASGDSYAAATGANPDGKIKAELEAPLAAWNSAAEAFAGAVDGAVASLRAGTEPATLDGAHKAYQDAARDFVMAVAKDMKRLLDVRVGGFQSRLTTMLALSAALVLLVVGFSVFSARSIIKALSGLEADIRGVAEGTSAEIGNTAGRTETARLARAVAHLREATIARLEDADRNKQSERDKANAAEHAADEERQRSDQARLAAADEQERVVASLAEGLNDLARGDLSARIGTAFSGKYEDLRAAFNRSLDQIAAIIAGIRSTSGALKVATGEILAGSNDLSDRTVKQAATIEETSATMEQLAQTVRDNAQRAEAVSVKARSVSEAAVHGADVMVQANAAMERITGSSGKISSIIGLIDDVAFQTNLLALNASVEAARAGEAGKGFAVVAVEVRRLAQSAAAASTQVKILIEASAGEVAEGTKLVADAASRLQAMQTALTENSTLIDGIAAASREQSVSLSEVTSAVRMLDEMTQHNAALVEETNAAIEQTEAEASKLDEIVAVFTLDTDDAEAAAA